MVRVVCDVCGATADRSFNEAEYSCDVCEMGAGMHTVDADLEERGKLRNLLERLGGQVLEKTPLLHSSVVPAFMHTYMLSNEMLDLLVLFFERTTLIIDSVDFDTSERAQIEDRIDAYSEAGLVVPLHLLPEWERVVSTSSRYSVELDSAFRQSNELNEYPQRLAYYLQMIGELETQDDIRASRAKYAHANAEWFRNPEHAHPSLLLNRANIYSALADAINSSVLFDSVLTKARTLKYHHRLSQLNTKRRALDSIAAWYGNEIRTLPFLKKPETMIAFRNSDAGQSFVDTVLREYMVGTREGGPETIERHLTTVMDQTLERARRVSGKSYEAKKTILSGLFSTLGDLMGGPAGAALGGIAGSAIVLAAERVDTAKVASWASFFIREGKRIA